MRHGAYVINRDEYESIGLHWIVLYVNTENVITNNIKKNIYKIQAYDSIMCGYFCIRFIDFMLKGKSLTLFPPNYYEKGEKIMLLYLFVLRLKVFQKTLVLFIIFSKCKNDT